MKNEGAAEQLEELPALELVVVETKTNVEKLMALFKKIQILKELNKKK